MSTKNIKFKRILSVVMSLCMILSYNVTTYAAEGDAGDAEKTYQYAPETCPGHEYTELFEEIEAPACVVEGIGAYACEKCGYKPNDGIGEIKAIPALGHDTEEKIEAATCTEDGTKTITCSRCDYEEVQTIPATGQHDFDESKKVEASAATCLKAKQIGFKCKNCDEFDALEDEGEPLAHSYTGDAVEVQAATCSAVAKMAKTCVNGCGETDPDKENWTDDEDGGYDNTNHNFEDAEDEELEAATCEDAAVWGKKCVWCSTAVDEESKHEEGEPDATAHDVDGVTATHVDATCAHGSYDVQICKNCGAEVKSNEDSTLDRDNHEWATELSVISAATCHEGEVKAYRCTNPECDAYDEKTKVVGDDLDEDNHVWGTEQKTLPADCTGNARVVTVCKYHADAEKLVKDLYQESVDNGAEDKSLKSKGHAERVLPAVKATCKKSGLTEGKECLVCGKILQAQEVVPSNPDAHAFPEEPDQIFKQETCSKTGLGKYICTEEGCDHVEYKVIPARHIYEEVVTKEPTCTEAGEKVMTCVREGGCTNASADDYTKTEVIKALGHEWGEGTVTKEATCTEEGERTYTCENGCGEEQTASIPMIAHDYQTTVIPATCKHPAQNGKACTECDKVDPNTAPEDITDTNDPNYKEAIDHDYQVDAEQSEDATCTEDGKTVDVCSMCGEKQETTVPAAGHTYAEGTGADGEIVDDKGNLITEVAPTCTEAGTYTRYCTACEENIELEDSEIEDLKLEVKPATNHEGTTEDLDEIPATCQEVGHEAGTYCNACEKYIDGGAEIPVDTTNGHEWKITPLKEATCTTNGVGKYECQNEGCGESKYAVIQAAHVWETEGEVTTPATCEDPGVMTYECENCTETKTEEIEALGHKWGEWDTTSQPANCGKTGTKTRTCERDDCGETETETLPIVGNHEYEYRVLPADCENPARVGSFCKVCDSLEPDADATVINDDNKDAIVAAYKVSVEYPSDEEEATQEQKDALAAFETSLVEKAALDHDYKTTTVDEPTCEDDGTTKITCSRCDYEDEGTIPKLGHDIEDEYIAPTCTECGKITQTCTRDCGYEKIENLEFDEATGHNLVVDPDNVLKAATCTTTGIGKLVCTNEDCDHTEYGVIPATHTYDEGVEETAATCTTDGEMLYTCTICGEDTEGHTKTEEIPATGHSYGEKEVVAATCTEPACVGQKCSKCHELKAGFTVITEENKAALSTELDTTVEPEDATGHDWENDSTIKPESEKAATCYDPGEKVYVCGDCGTETKVEIPKREHDLVDTYHEATCTEAGYLVTTCEYDDCDYSEEDHETFAALDPALDHDLKDVEAQLATCIAPGHASGQRCTRCDYETGCEEIDPDPTNGHVWDEGVEQGDDICNKGGTLVKTCTLCEAATTEEPIEPGHKWERQAITDEETGKTAAIVKGCARCHTVDEYLYMPKGFGYCPDDGLVAIPEDYVIEAVDATCTTPGSTEGRKCPTCEKVILEPQEIPVIDHTYQEEVTIEEATCNSDGSKAKLCSVCGNTYDEETVPATGIHDYQDVLVDATCNTNAVVKHICTSCKQEDPDHPADVIPDSIDESAHIYDGEECINCHNPMPEGYVHCEKDGWVKGTVVEGTEPTCTGTGLSDGIKCSVCGEWIEEQTVLDEKGHTLGEWIELKAATCTTPGSKQAKCSVCQEQYGDEVEIPTLDHDYTKWVVDTPATCKDAGVEKQVCKNCDGESGETREIPKSTNHSYEEQITDATCMSPYTVTMVCTVCGDVGTTQTVGEPDPNAHEFEDGVCKHCHKSAEELGGYVECPTDGWVEGLVVRGTEATCTTPGTSNGIKCPTCGEWIEEPEEIPVKDHTFDEWEELKPATCKDAGTKIAKCSVCQEQYGDEVEIPATGEHDYTDEGFIDATCTSNAYITFSCTVCGEEDESLRQEVEDTKLGHSFVDGVCGNCGALDVQVATTGTPAIIDGSYKVTMRSDIDVADESMEIVEKGVLYITAKAYAGDAKEDMSFTVNEENGTYSIVNTSVRAVKYTSSDANLADIDYVYATINLGTTEANNTRTLYGRGYVIVKKDGKYSVQFDDNVVQGTYADGFTAQ